MYSVLVLLSLNPFDSNVRLHSSNFLLTPVLLSSTSTTSSAKSIHQVQKRMKKWNYFEKMVMTLIWFILLLDSENQVATPTSTKENEKMKLFRKNGYDIDLIYPPRQWKSSSYANKYNDWSCYSLQVYRLHLWNQWQWSCRDKKGTYIFPCIYLTSSQPMPVLLPCSYQCNKDMLLFQTHYHLVKKPCHHVDLSFPQNIVTPPIHIWL